MKKIKYKWYGEKKNLAKSHFLQMFNLQFIYFTDANLKLHKLE